MKKYKPPLSSPTDLCKKFDHYLTLPLQQKLKLKNSICAETLALLKNVNDSLEDLNLYERILQTIAKLPNAPSSSKSGLSKIAALRLQIMGIPEPKIRLKKNLELPTDIASFIIRDQRLPEHFFEEITEYKKCVERMNNGEFFWFSTGADAWFNVQLRLVEGTEPILSLKEYKRVEGSSQEAIIHIPSGKIVISGYSHEALSEDENLGGSLDVSPGFYKVKVFVFSFPNDDFSYYVVFAKTDTFMPNSLTEIETLP